MPKAKIIPLYTSRLRDADSCMNVIRMSMYDHDIETIADAIGVTTSCLYSVRRGSTVWPRPKTFFGLINYLNLELTLTRRN